VARPLVKKHCRKCQTETDWYTDKNGKPNLCKVCQNAHMKVYYVDHRDEALSRAKEYGKKKFKEDKAFRTYHNHYSKQYQYKYRANLLKAREKGTHTHEEWLRKLKKYGNKCAYCGCDLNADNASKDHAIPLSRGGRDTITNIVPCCRFCNSAKGGRTPYEWFRARRLAGLPSRRRKGSTGSKGSIRILG
jgi:CRISPR/Cas system Type II protein with McrA/HNH and RuvC-like nuclease domain